MSAQYRPPAPRPAQHFGGTFAPDVEGAGKMKCQLHGAREEGRTRCAAGGRCGLGTGTPATTCSVLARPAPTGWKLDPATMTYVEGSNPKLLGMTMKQPEHSKQPELVVTPNADGSISLAVAEGSGCSVA